MLKRLSARRCMYKEIVMPRCVCAKGHTTHRSVYMLNRACCSGTVIIKRT